MHNTRPPPGARGFYQQADQWLNQQQMMELQQKIAPANDIGLALTSGGNEYYVANTTAGQMTANIWNLIPVEVLHEYYDFKYFQVGIANTGGGGHALGAAIYRWDPIDGCFDIVRNSEVYLPVTATGTLRATLNGDLHLAPMTHYFIAAASSSALVQYGCIKSSTVETAIRTRTYTVTSIVTPPAKIALTATALSTGRIIPFVAYLSLEGGLLF